MKIYTVYFYYNQWSDSYEEDRLYFTTFEKAKKHEEYLKKENHEQLIEDEDFGVYFEEIDVIS